MCKYDKRIEESKLSEIKNNEKKYNILSNLLLRLNFFSQLILEKKYLNKPEGNRNN